MNATLARGTNLDEAENMSNQLVETSWVYKKTAKDTNRKMCWRKYMVYIIGVLLVLGLIGIIILIVKI